MKASLLILSIGVLGALAFANKNPVFECVGNGPDYSTAKVDAIQKCKVLVSEQLSKKVNIRSTSIETEKDTSYFSSVYSEQTVENLKCDVVKSDCKEDQEKTTCKISCRFDLTKVSLPQEPNNKKVSRKEIESKSVEPSGAEIRSDSFSVSISTVPQCRLIQILGKRPRSIQCKKNPVEVLLYVDDEKLRFLAEKRKPIELTIEEIKERGSNATILFQ